MKPAANGIAFAPCAASDFEDMLAMRLAAMRESLLRAGRFDPDRSRERLKRSFYPEQSQFILRNAERIGFYTFRTAADGFHLEHFYLLPAHQSAGIGSFVLARLIAQADAAGAQIFLGALKESPANRFYQRHGFVKMTESEWDAYYVRPPSAST
jgi:GNAT superfamily N-acetyltransferase